MLQPICNAWTNVVMPGPPVLFEPAGLPQPSCRRTWNDSMAYPSRLLQAAAGVGGRQGHQAACWAGAMAHPRQNRRLCQGTRPHALPPPHPATGLSPPSCSQLLIALYRQAGHPDTADAGAQVASAVQDLQASGWLARLGGQGEQAGTRGRELVLDRSRWAACQHQQAIASCLCGPMPSGRSCPHLGRQVWQPRQRHKQAHVNGVRHCEQQQGYDLQRRAGAGRQE